MKNKNQFLTGAIITSALLSGFTSYAKASSLFSFNNLGSGAEVRAALLGSSSSVIDGNTLELNCGNKGADSTSAMKNEKTMNSKSKDGKCGEGKCGGNKKKMAKTKMNGKGQDSKSKDGNCGNK